MNNRQREENTGHLIAVLSYILNEAGQKEIEVIAKAVERRNAELGSSHGLSALNPETYARQMSESIHKSIQTSVDGVRNTFREFAVNLIAKEAPELTREQAQALINSWIAPAGGNYKKAAVLKNRKVNGIPPDAILEMVLQFVSFSLGEMSGKENKELRNSIGDWPKKYWENFPQEIQSEIKKFLHGETTSGKFQKRIKELIS